jgi:small conductance mechanosensitive channel
MNFTDSFWGFFSSIHVSLAVILRLIGMVLLVLVIEGIVKLILESLKIENKHRAKTVVTVLNSSIRYLAAIVIICWGLSIIGVDVATIAASVGIVALIIGFGAESLIEDAITGIFMLFENQYNVGDIIEVNGFRGEVSEIGIRTTSVRDGSNNVKIINNAQMKNVLNRSDNYSSAVCDIGIPYETDLEAFESKIIPDILKNIYEANKEVITAEPKYLGVQELGDSAVVLRFSCQCVEKEIYNAARILNHDLLIQFGKNGVHCPCQKLDVHSI